MTATFKDHELAGWTAKAASYVEYFGRATAHIAPPLLDAASVGRGIRLLDVACGPGYVANAGAERGASVVGVDFAPTMVEQARKRYPAVRFEIGDAEALAFDAGSFDALTCAFGIGHFADPDRAMREALRVLREKRGQKARKPQHRASPGGLPLAQGPYLRQPQRALQEQLGSIDGQHAPSAHAMPSSMQLVELIGCVAHKLSYRSGTKPLACVAKGSCRDGLVDGQRDMIESRVVPERVEDVLVTATTTISGHVHEKRDQEIWRQLSVACEALAAELEFTCDGALDLRGYRCERGTKI